MENGSDSSHLTSPTVNLKTRDQIRRETGKFPNPPNGNVNGGSSAHFSSPDGMDGERRPLLGHQTASTLHAEPGFWRHLLVNSQSSPGTDSPNPFVRWPARVWNVTKITLFSCTYLTRQA
jgi:Ca2+:H+ antiporter